MKAPIDTKLQRYRSSLSNALSYAPLRKTLTRYSYDRPTLLKGEALLQKALKLQLTKDDTLGAQKDATDAIQQRWRSLKAVFTEHRQLARIAFKSQRGVLTQLKLNDPLKTSFSGWVTQATAFYTKVGNHLEGMNRYGVDAQGIATVQTQLEELLALYDQQLQRKAEAQHTTEQRNKVIKELDHWMREFYQIAKIALKDEPQQLEMLGIVVATPA